MVSPEKPLQWWVRCFSPPTLFAFSNYQNHAPGKLLTHQKSNSLTTLCANCSYFLAPHSLPCKHACAHSHTFQTHSHLLSICHIHLRRPLFFTALGNGNKRTPWTQSWTTWLQASQVQLHQGVFCGHQETCERVTGRKVKGLQKEEIGCKCQTFFISLKQQEETN